MTTKERGIRLSPKHGVNATVPRCYFCGEAKNEVALLGYLPGDKEAPMGAVLDREPCDTCADWMTKGVILIGMTGPPDRGGQRTGHFVVVRDELVERLFVESAAERVLKARAALVDLAMLREYGIVTDEEDES